MKNKHPLWLIFGPVLAAVLLVGVALMVPHHASQLSRRTLNRAATSLSVNVMRGQAVKNQAIKAGYVPFLGSSELSRFDVMHPSVLAQKYHRSYRPLLMGKAGTQSLIQYFNITSMHSLKNKKAVFIISPQWFTRQGQSSAAFSYYHSPLAITSWVLQAHDTLPDRYAANRVLSMKTVSDNSMLGQALSNVARGRQLTTNQRHLLKIKQRVLQSEDNLFGGLGVTGQGMHKVQQQLPHLPAHYSVKKLDQLAIKTGRRQTNSNDFQIINRFYHRRLTPKKLARLEDSQTDFDYRQSPEYADLQLVLNQFAKMHTDVLFIMPPVNQRWAAYTGLSPKMLQQTNQKIKYQLKSQGFNNVLDLTNKGRENYFMQDTIHLGWRGWLAVDQAVRPFMATKTIKQPTYHIQNRFYSSQWQYATDLSHLGDSTGTKN